MSEDKAKNPILESLDGLCVVGAILCIVGWILKRVLMTHIGMFLFLTFVGGCALFFALAMSVNMVLAPLFCSDFLIIDQWWVWSSCFGVSGLAVLYCIVMWYLVDAPRAKRKAQEEARREAEEDGD